MSRDGASLINMYSTVRQSSRTLLVIETIHGEVFGAFVSSPWRERNNIMNYYGSCEAFLWKMRQSRFTPTCSMDEQVELERDIEVFSWSQLNRNISPLPPLILVLGCI